MGRWGRGSRGALDPITITFQGGTRPRKGYISRGALDPIKVTFQGAGARGPGAQGPRPVARARRPPKIATPPVRLIRRRPPGVQNCNPCRATNSSQAAEGRPRPHAAARGPYTATRGPSSAPGPCTAPRGPYTAEYGLPGPAMARIQPVRGPFGSPVGPQADPKEGLQLRAPGGLRRISRRGGAAILGPRGLRRISRKGGSAMLAPRGPATN